MTTPPPPRLFQSFFRSVPRRSPSVVETSLDPQETNPQFHLPSDTDWRHRFWAPRRAQVLAALDRAGVPRSRLLRFANCGAGASVLRHRLHKDRFRVAAHYCHDRCCEPCTLTRRRRLVAALRGRLSAASTRFVTLTLRARPEPLATTIRRLYASFAALRRRRFFASATRGGVAFLEITRNRTTCLWHVHLHVLHIGSFIPHELLRRAWLAITRDSFVVDIRRVDDSDRAIAYVAKYATAPLPVAIWAQAEAAAEAVSALRGVRGLVTWGIARGWNLTHHPVEDEPDAWQSCGSLQFVLAQASAGNPEFLRILAALTRSNHNACDYDRDPAPLPPLSAVRPDP